jgi:hypothetical protein
LAFAQHERVAGGGMAARAVGFKFHLAAGIAAAAAQAGH